MSYKQIKWLILTIPVLTIGLWEYVRHEYLLSYISMELGNWLAPVIVFLVSILLLTQLFSMIERNQEELNQSKAMQAAMEEREKLARELHDGIAQSLFLLNVQVDQIANRKETEGPRYDRLKENVHRTNSYVRQAIANLRYPPDPASIPWLQSIHSLIDELEQETGLFFSLQWNLPESVLLAKDKIELLAIIREALLNIHKHAEAKRVRIEMKETLDGWLCTVADDGKGFDSEQMNGKGRYGVKMMKDRALKMNWRLELGRVMNETVVSIRKEIAA